MAALTAVLVPGQIGQSLDDAERFDEAFAAAAMAMPITGQRAEPLVALVGHERPQRRRLRVELEHPHRLLHAVVVLGPPRLAVVGSRAADPLVDVGGNGGHLVGFEHAADVQKPRFAKKVTDLVMVVVDGEAAVEVEWVPVEVGEGDVAGLVHLAAVEQGPKHRLPTDPPVEVAGRQPHARRHGQAHGRLGVLHEIGQGICGELGDDPGVIDTRLGDEIAIANREGQRPPLDLEPQTRETLVRDTVRGERTVGGQRFCDHAVEHLVARQRTDLFVHTSSLIDRHRDLPEVFVPNPITVGRRAARLFPTSAALHHDRRRRLAARPARLRRSTAR